MNRKTDTSTVDKRGGKTAAGEDEGIDGLSGLNGYGGPQERLINGCYDVVKGKAAA